MSILVDSFGRRIDYLRVSVTDRCNFRCIYCMPEQGFPATPKDEHLTADEFGKLIEVAASLGMTKLRITGGEPLLRKDLPAIIERATRAGFTDISLTTNGHLLAERAVALKKAGLGRVNVSLDTLHEEPFQEIARRGSLLTVLEGIEAALGAGLEPVKINCVVLKGLNDQEAPDFAEWTLRAPIHVRFIELMPMRWNLDEALPSPFREREVGGSGLLAINQTRGDMLSDADMRRRYVSVDQLKAKIEQVHGPLEPAQIKTNGPARTFRVAGAEGTIGFISQISNDLCTNCNRLRLTHDGFLRPCLMSDGELDLRTPLREGASVGALQDLFRYVVERKPERHYLHEGQKVMGRGMSQIGG
ncbi:MAG TPA: GTP 3',8-cyclase MoaA [Fimbriimonas sp.]|nr:GTP 3',8-cyclase MoaA [Fimbriimonas sp.]